MRFPSEDLQICSNLLRCTGLDVKIAEIKFQTREHEILGKILGTADLIGQMANEHYLEKLPFLYNEFKEGGVQCYKDEFDLLKKTPAFWEMVKERFVLRIRARGSLSAGLLTGSLGDKPGLVPAGH